MVLQIDAYVRLLIALTGMDALEKTVPGRKSTNFLQETEFNASVGIESFANAVVGMVEEIPAYVKLFKALTGIERLENAPLGMVPCKSLKTALSADPGIDLGANAWVGMVPSVIRSYLTLAIRFKGMLSICMLSGRM